MTVIRILVLGGLSRYWRKYFEVLPEARVAITIKSATGLLHSLY